MADKSEVIDLLFDRPADIAVAIGYDRLTNLHNLWIQDMVFGEGDKTLQSHRGSFKTTCISVSLADILVFFPHKRVMFLRKTDDDVKEVINATAAILRTPYYKSIVQTLYEVELTLTVCTQSEIDTNLKQGVSGASQLVGLGCGGSLTGKHADIIFTDDIINVKDRVSNAERKRIKLLYMELQNIRNPGGRIFNTGTPWHKDDAFTLMPNIVRYDCYSTGLRTREQLQEIRASMSASLFAANYELKHIADGEAMFKEPRFFSDPKMLCDGIGHIDAAYGGGDYSAFTCLMRRDGKMYAYGRMWAKHVDDCLDEILLLCKAMRIGTIHCERNADKGYLAKEIRKKGHPVKGYAEGTNKFIKISTYLKKAWPSILILDCDEYPLDAEWLDQILEYTEDAAHDDAPDSMASIVRQYVNRIQMKGSREGI